MLLTDQEDAILAYLKQSALHAKLAKIDSLPDTENESIVKRFTTEAPAIYVVAGNFPIDNGAAALRYGLVCVAKNARGPMAARQGDGKVIGLYEMMSTAASIMNSAYAGGVSWKAVAGDFVADDVLYKAGLQVGVVRIESYPCLLDAAIDESTLDDFLTLHSDYDIAPHESTATHDAWLQNPPDYSNGVPELSDVLTLPQEEQ